MTALVTVQPAGDLTRVRRYEGRSKGSLLCSHEGFYDADTVTSWNVASYQGRPPEQDRRGWRSGKDASWDHYGKQPA